MSLLIGIRIELLDTDGRFAGAISGEDRFEVVAVPQPGNLVALAAVAGPPAADSSLPELQSIHALADAFPFMTVHRIEHFPAADHQVGERPGCIVASKGTCRRVTRARPRWSAFSG
jgi:hypothetical protein